MVANFKLSSNMAALAEASYSDFALSITSEDAVRSALESNGFSQSQAADFVQDWSIITGSHQPDMPSGFSATLTDFHNFGGATVNGEYGDFLSGGSGNDSLIGSAQSDALMGGEGDDLLVGGAGHDVIFGDATYQTAGTYWTVRGLPQQKGNFARPSNNRNVSIQTPLANYRNSGVIVGLPL